MDEQNEHAIAENEQAQTPVSDKKKSFKEFLRSMPKRYFIIAFTGMAMGLFCTLIAGTIIKQIGELLLSFGGDFFEGVGNALCVAGKFAQLLMGAGIGAGIAHSLKGNKLIIFSAMAAGMCGAFAGNIISGGFAAANTIALQPGNPIGAYVTSLIATEIGLLVSGKTKVDIVLVPLAVILTGLLCVYAAWPFIKLVDLLGYGIQAATGTVPFVMGIVIAVVMGVLLTMPTSSAAIWIAVATPILSSGNPEMVANMLLAGGAAVVGCAAHMVGYAVMSFRENRWGGLIAQGLGTSMLQIPNIMKNPRSLIPPIIASAIAGPLSTCVFKLYCNAAGGGMGTSGLVGVIGTVTASSGVITPWVMWLGIILLMFVLPATICFFVSEFMRKKNWLKPEDLKLPD